MFKHLFLDRWETYNDHFCEDGTYGNLIGTSFTTLEDCEERCKTGTEVLKSFL